MAQEHREVASSSEHGEARPSLKIRTCRSRVRAEQHGANLTAPLPGSWIRIVLGRPSEGRSAELPTALLTHTCSSRNRLKRGVPGARGVAAANGASGGGGFDCCGDVLHPSTAWRDRLLHLEGRYGVIISTKPRARMADGSDVVGGGLLLAEELSAAVRRTELCPERCCCSRPCVSTLAETGLPGPATKRADMCAQNHRAGRRDTVSSRGRPGGKGRADPGAEGPGDVVGLAFGAPVRTKKFAKMPTLESSSSPAPGPALPPGRPLSDRPFLGH